MSLSLLFKKEKKRIDREVSHSSTIDTTLLIHVQHIVVDSYQKDDKIFSANDNDIEITGNTHGIGKCQNVLLSF